MRILVTGATSGLGRAAALACAGHGATVVLLGRQVRALEKVYDAIEAAGGAQPAIYPMNLEGAAPQDYEELAAAGGMLGHGGVVVFDDTVDMAEMARYAMEFCALESCGKCTPCRIGSVRGVEVMDRIIAREAPAQDIALLRDLCDTMEAGSLCAMGGLTPYPVRSALEHFPEDFS